MNLGRKKRNPSLKRMILEEVIEGPLKGNSEKWMIISLIGGFRPI